MKINLNLPSQIQTERTTLKKHSLDKEYIQLMVDSINESREFLGRFLSHFEKPATFEGEEAFVKKVLSEEKEIGYAIWNTKTKELMGCFGVFNPDNPENPKRVELGIMLFEKFAGQSYASEVTDAVENVLFQNGIEETVLNIQKDHMRSRRTAEKSGHVWDGEIVPNKKDPNLQMFVYKKYSDLRKR